MVSWIAVVSSLPKVLSCCTLVIGASFVVMLSFAVSVSLKASQSASLKLREGFGGIWDWGRSK